MMRGWAWRCGFRTTVVKAGLVSRLSGGVMGLAKMGLGWSIMPNAQSEACWVVSLPEPRMCSDQNGVNSVATRKWAERNGCCPCRSGGTLRISRERFSSNVRSQNCCVHAVCIVGQPHVMERCTRFAIMNFTPCHRVMRVFFVGGPASANVVEASSQSRRRVEIVCSW